MMMIEVDVGAADEVANAVVVDAVAAVEIKEVRKMKKKLLNRQVYLII